MFTKFALRLLKGLLRISLHRRPFKNYSHLSNKLGGWNKRGGGTKVAKSKNVVGILQLESSPFVSK